MLIESKKEIDISNEINSEEFKNILSFTSTPSFSEFKSNDEGIKIIIDKIKFFDTEGEIIKGILASNSISNKNTVLVISKWLQVWKYLKDNLNKFRINDFISCGLKDSLILNIFDALMNENTGIFVPLLRIWLDQDKPSICTGREVIKPNF